MGYFKKIYLSLFVLIASPIFLFLILEILARTIPVKESYFDFLRNNKVEEPLPIKERKYDLVVDFNYQKKINFSQPNLEKVNAYKPMNFYQKTKYGYLIYKSYFLGSHKSFSVDTGQNIFDVTYSFDQYGRRVTPDKNGGVKEKHLILSGCSMTFGEGLEDHQTLSAQLQNLRPRERVYNLARMGGSVVDAITMIEITDAWKGVTPEKGALLFSFSNSMHMERFLGTLLNVGMWNEHGAFLKKNKTDNSYSYGGVYIFDKKLWTIFSKIFSRSAFLKLIDFDWPPLNSKAYESYAEAINDLRNKYQNLYGKENQLIVYLFPGEISGQKIIPFLEKYKIFYLDYSSFELHSFAEKPLAIPLDGHPTEEYNRILSKQISHDLDNLENQKKIGWK